MTPTKPHGLFLNQPQAQCSIYESGRMVYEALKSSERFSLEYFTLSPETCGKIPAADFYLFNYHHATMAWLNPKSFSLLPGKKISTVLEMLPGNPFVYVSPEYFDAYLVLDPTMNIENPKVYGFPRPLEPAVNIRPYEEKPVPWIGTFGFATPGKGFEHVVEAVNREFDRALVRINIPVATFAEETTAGLQNRNYAEYLSEISQRMAKPGIEVQVTREFMSKEQLIDWCAQNTLNCFLYCRNQPGLSATTDQCITAGRPMAVSANETFRHIHQYLLPYPEMGLRESLNASQESVERMREEWTTKNFQLRFEEMLTDLNVLPEQAGTKKWFLPLPPKKKPLLWISSPSGDPGLALAAWTAAAAIRRSGRFTPVEIPYTSREELLSAAAIHRPAAAVFMYDASAMRHLSKDQLDALPCPAVAVVPPQHDADPGRLREAGFSRVLPIQSAPSENALPRVLPLSCNESNLTPIPMIAVHFYGPGYTRCSEVLSRIEAEFERVHILSFMPIRNPHSAEARRIEQIAHELQLIPRKIGVSLSFVHDHCPGPQLSSLMMLPSMHLFSELRAEDLVFVDYALSSQRPVAIMSGAAVDTLDPAAAEKLLLGRRSLSQVLQEGVVPLVPLYNDWSEIRFALALEKALAHIFQPQEAGTRPSLPLNRLLSGEDVDDYRQSLEALHRFAATLVERSSADDIAVQAFTLSTVERFAGRHPHPRILGIGTQRDAAAKVLRKQGWIFEEVDPETNFDLNTFYNLPSTAYNSYDIIFAPSALSDTADGEMFIAQIGDLLAPGGVAILACEFLPEGMPVSARGPGNLRAYTEADIKDRFLPLLQNCVLADVPQWAGRQDAQVRFASLVITKIENGL
jgi:hypothetical protein